MRILVCAALALLCGCTAVPENAVAESASAVGAQPSRLIAESNVVDIRDGEQLSKGNWSLNASLNPDIYTAQLKKGERREVCFLSGGSSLCRTVGIGDVHDFIVSYRGVDYATRIVGKYVPPMAVFDSAYQQANRGRFRIAIPEAYELVNIAIALTPTARQDPYMAAKHVPYYQEVLEHFAPVMEHPLVLAFDKELRSGAGYATLKMNGNAFEFDARGKVVRSKVYDRTAFSGNPENVLLPYLSLMQDFSDKSGFRAFYASHRSLYQSQIDYFRNQINTTQMLTWLRAQFPEVKPYDTTSVIFSPLVYANQSVTWIESNGFRELQPHINFPYPAETDKAWSDEAVALRRGYLIFTELNHGFINPTADKYASRIADAATRGDLWAMKGKASEGYGNSYALFTEMMNWALVSLYLNDHAPAGERDRLIEALNPMMAERRGFPQFPAFNAFLVNLYRSRAAGTTVADLYPQIIQWFEDRNKAAGEAKAAA
ncbi:MAG TPA: DUF4932 domain-containing protein [Allosphingosinicella sp.]|jgi:hypothetical protein